MKLMVKKTGTDFNKNETIALFIREEEVKNISKNIPSQFEYIFKYTDLKFFKGKPSEVFFMPIADKANFIIVGLGNQKKITPDSIKTASSRITSKCIENEIDNINIFIPEDHLKISNNFIRSVVEGAYLSNYSFDKYKSKDRNGNGVKKLLSRIYIISDTKGLSKSLSELEVIMENILLCRDLVNETSDYSNPEHIAREAKRIGKLKNASCKVYGKKEIENLKMGLLLAVNRGSKVPPQLVVLKYTGDPKNKKYFAIVGKGITYDSGGLNLKPSGHLETMRMDMAGAATVLYTFKAVAELGLKKNLYAIIPLTENMLSNDSYRPGDVFKAFNGKTVEIGNTDAEGRLILADALSFCEKKLKPSCIVDLATLTGACLVAFGETVAGYLTNDKEFGKILEVSSESTGEKIWQLPLHKEYEENLKSEIADLNNISSEKNAGTIIGATFLKNFIKNTKWAHIDIAGTAWYSKPRGHIPKNATGFGVNLMVDVIKNWK